MIAKNAWGRVILIGLLTSISFGADAAAPEEKPDPWGPTRVQEGPLRLSMSVEQLLGKNTVNVVLSNPSNAFFCLSARMFDTRAQRILFKDKHDRLVSLKIFMEAGPTTLLGFDYTDSYVFILPNETRRIGIDMSNFEPMVGEYKYEMLFLYYRCSDVIDRERIQAKKEIPAYVVEGTGATILPEEQD